MVQSKIGVLIVDFLLFSLLEVELVIVGGLLPGLWGLLPGLWGLLLGLWELDSTDEVTALPVVVVLVVLSP